MERRVVYPGSVANTLQYGFSQAVVTQGGRRVHLSGQVGVDAREQQKFIGRALRERFPVNPPATSWILVSGLSEPEWLIEIEAEAVLPLDGGAP